jgi:hypothetical protein
MLIPSYNCDLRKRFKYVIQNRMIFAWKLLQHKTLIQRLGYELRSVFVMKSVMKDYIILENLSSLGAQWSYVGALEL